MSNLPDTATSSVLISQDTFLIITEPTFACCGVITEVEIASYCPGDIGRLYLQTLNREGNQYVVYDSFLLEESCGEPRFRLRSFPVNLKFKSGHHLGFYAPSNDNLQNYQVALHNMGPDRPSEFIIIPSAMHSISIPPSINDSFSQSSFQGPLSGRTTHIPIIRLTGN